MQRILFIGDVVSQIGCDFLREKLSTVKKENNIDIVIANGENSAVGNGILPNSANFLLDSGVDIITTGNHVFRRREMYEYLDESDIVIRPANYPEGCNGKGICLLDKGAFRLLVINLQGTVYMENISNPFYAIDELLKEHQANLVIVDFHAEATGEKKAMGYYLDGRVALMVGTHTHIQTADEQIFEKGTGYITDVGMTGPVNSVLGVTPEGVISRYLTSMPTRFETAEGKCQMDCIVAELDEKTNRCLNIKRLNII